MPDSQSSYTSIFRVLTGKTITNLTVFQSINKILPPKKSLRQLGWIQYLGIHTDPSINITNTFSPSLFDSKI